MVEFADWSHIMVRAWEDGQLKSFTTVAAAARLPVGAHMTTNTLKETALLSAC